MTIEEYYQEAIENPLVRQAFIDSLDLSSITPYTRSVRYSKKPRMKDNMATFHPFINLRFIFPRKSKIVVYPSSFQIDTHQTAQDFLSTLIDHEGYHAMRHFTGARPPSPNVMDPGGCVVHDMEEELRVYQYQVNNFATRGVSEHYRNRMLESIGNIESFLKQYK